MSRTWRNTASMVGVAVVLAGVAAAPAGADMHTEQLSNHLCKTTRGGKFVRIPGFPGERIDRRLLPDIRWMKRKFDIWITDGYATSGHAINGEHPIGLALDIVPNQSTGGSWHKLGNLARRFEPHQNQVRLPFRWIGWNGDAGHGRGDHLHLSYAHSTTRPRHPARVVYTRNCPGRKRDHGSGGGNGGGGNNNGGGGGGNGSGGIGGRAKELGRGLTPHELAQLAPVVPEGAEPDAHG